LPFITSRARTNGIRPRCLPCCASTAQLLYSLRDQAVEEALHEIESMISCPPANYCTAKSGEYSVMPATSAFKHGPSINTVRTPSLSITNHLGTQKLPDANTKKTKARTRSEVKHSFRYIKQVLDYNTFAIAAWQKSQLDALAGRVQ
jgi:hypothetical protein